MFEINKIYNFSTLAPSILGANYTNAKCIGILDYTSANKEENVEVKYRNIYPVLPNGTLDDARNVVYYRFTSEAGIPFILCEQWIDDGTIVLVVPTNYRIILNDTSLANVNAIRDVINSLGILDYSIETL